MVRNQILEIEVDYKETGEMPVLSTIKPFNHDDVRRISFTRKSDDRLFVKIRLEKSLYENDSNRLAEIWYLAEGDGTDSVTWLCGSSPRTNRAVPESLLPSYCRDDVPRN